MSSQTDVANKIKKWLDEDKITYESWPDENAYFHIQAIIGNAKLYLVQPKIFADSFVISFNISSGDEDRKALQQQDKAKKQELVRKLRYELINDPDLLNFELVPFPNMPDDIAGIGLRSMRFIIDGLSKAKLMHSTYNIAKKLFKIIVE